jgi:hypothetical protein
VQLLLVEKLHFVRRDVTVCQFKKKKEKGKTPFCTGVM